MVQPDRRLVPIVSLDVVGYSRLVERNERQTLRLVQRVYERLVTRTIGAAGGKVFKTMGDGLLAEFSSVVAAVQWTADLQREIHERKISRPGRRDVPDSRRHRARRRAGGRQRPLRLGHQPCRPRPEPVARRAACASPSGCINISTAPSICPSSTWGRPSSRTSPRPSASTPGIRVASCGRSPADSAPPPPPSNRPRWLSCRSTISPARPTRATLPTPWSRKSPPPSAG